MVSRRLKRRRETERSTSTLHEALAEHGPPFGYRITKCHIMTKKNHTEHPEETFKNKDVDILKGHRLLGSVVRSASACHDIKTKIASEHAKTISKLSQHAKKQPLRMYISHILKACKRNCPFQLEQRPTWKEFPRSRKTNQRKSIIDRQQHCNDH